MRDSLIFASVKAVLVALSAMKLLGLWAADCDFIVLGTKLNLTTPPNHTPRKTAHPLWHLYIAVFRFTHRLTALLRATLIIRAGAVNTSIFFFFKKLWLLVSWRYIYRLNFSVIKKKTFGFIWLFSVASTQLARFYWFILLLIISSI